MVGLAHNQTTGRGVRGLRAPAGAHHLRIAVLLTGDWHTAEDLTQTCLVKLYQVWHRLDSGTDLDRYLRRILVNTHRSWWRTRWRREVPIARIPDQVHAADGQDRHALAATVRQALARLPRGSGPRWRCATTPTCPRRRWLTSWAARWARSRRTPTAASSGSGVAGRAARPGRDRSRVITAASKWCDS